MHEPNFFEDSGLVWVDLGPEWVGFSEALNDGVSALSPKGQPAALSTYWIDDALSNVASPPGTKVTGGNSSRIVRSETGVRARSDYEMFEDEEMAVDDFVRLLRAWRREVTERIDASDPARPQHAPYQRNP